MNLVNKDVSTILEEKLLSREAELRKMWMKPSPVRYFILDDLFPVENVETLAKKFPASGRLMLRSTIRERKHVGVDYRNYDPMIGEYLFAFQDRKVINVIGRITGMNDVEADPTLYASGISVMERGDFLNPHLDNSHDGDGFRYRVLNLLYYVSPDWTLENGGNFELWDKKILTATTILSKFNRLVVIETNQFSWHSVNPVRVNQPRLCVSNYYFSNTPPGGEKFFHVTTFAGRPEERIKRFVLKVDGTARNIIGQLFPKMARKTKHRVTKV